MTLRFLLTLILFTAFSSFASTKVSAQQRIAPQTAPHVLAPDEIIRRFIAKESESYSRFKTHSFIRDITVQMIGMGGQVAGEYRRKSRITTNATGVQTEHVITASISPLVPTAEDIKDFATIQTFAVEPDRAGEYDFTYIGKERVDELDVYVFDAKPKALEDPKLAKQAIKNKDRYFAGRIYIDTQDFQIVKARGKGVPEGKQRYPTFETYRAQAVGQYWFPSYTFAEDDLVYPNGNVQRVRLRIKFSDYELQNEAAGK